MNHTEKDVKQARIIIDLYRRFQNEPAKLKQLGVTEKNFRSHRDRINRYLSSIKDDTKREVMRIVLYTGIDPESAVNCLCKDKSLRLKDTSMKSVSEYIDRLKEIG